MKVKTAIIQFLANEFHMDPETLTEDTNFESDLGLKPQQVTELLQNLQDSLNIILPEEDPKITTIGQLLSAIETEGEEETND